MRTAGSPDTSWDSATYVDTILLTHSTNMSPEALLAKGPQIVEAVEGGPLRTVKPYTREVRAYRDCEFRLGSGAGIGANPRHACCTPVTDRP